MQEFKKAKNSVFFWTRARILTFWKKRWWPGWKSKEHCGWGGQAPAETRAGTIAVRYLQGKKISLGKFAVANPVFCEGLNNILGLDFLSRFKVTLDFPNKAMYLEKGKRYAEPNLRDLSGLHILRKQGRTVVDSVVKASVAESAGIKAGDKIVKMGEKKAEEVSLFELRRAFSQPGTTLNLTIQREERTLAVNLALKK